MTDAQFFTSSCRGFLTHGDLQVSIAFELKCSREGDLVLEIEKVPLTPETFGLNSAFNQGRLLQLQASTSSGDAVTSSTVYLTSYGTRTDEEGDWITLAAGALRLNVATPDFAAEDSAAGVRASYYAIGIRAFGVRTVDTRAGRLRLLAKRAIESYDEISGLFEIEARSSAKSISEWLSEADEVALEVLDLLSFAEGRLIRWTVRQLVLDKRIIETEFLGPTRTGNPRRGFYHWLDLQPVLELAAGRYTPELKKETGIDVALEWSLMNPRYVELDLIACFTALEHLSDVYQKKKKKTSPPGRAYFNSVIEPKLTAQLEELLESAPDAEAVSAIEKARGKLRDLTRATLQDSITGMLNGYSVPWNDLQEFLPELIQNRNGIVHQNVAREELQAKLQQHVTIVRELLTRVFLTLLGYRGKYYSYLTGRGEFRSFPPDS
jgi:hypothetical protein